MGAGRRRSQCDEGLRDGMGKRKGEAVGALYICPVSIATVGRGLEFLTTVF